MPAGMALSKRLHRDRLVQVRNLLLGFDARRFEARTAIKATGSSGVEISPTRVNSSPADHAPSPSASGAKLSGSRRARLIRHSSSHIGRRAKAALIFTGRFATRRRLHKGRPETVK